MVSLPEDRCAQCAGPVRPLEDGTTVCDECDYESPMGGDEMRSPVLVERPGMFRSWSTLGWIVLMLLLSGIGIASVVTWIVR